MAAKVKARFKTAHNQKKANPVSKFKNKATAIRVEGEEEMANGKWRITQRARKDVSGIDYRLILDYMRSMKLISVSELKASAGEIVDRALEGKPQYVVRRGSVAIISKAELITGVEERPPGYFADAYRAPDSERLVFEKAMGKGKQRIER
jgi:prevent-host-death family protein